MPIEGVVIRREYLPGNRHIPIPGLWMHNQPYTRYEIIGPGGLHRVVMPGHRQSPAEWDMVEIYTSPWNVFGYAGRNQFVTKDRADGTKEVVTNHVIYTPAVRYKVTEPEDWYKEWLQDEQFRRFLRSGRLQPNPI